MADTQRFFSWLVNDSATEVQRQISRRGRTDWLQWHNSFSWYDPRRQHNATSSGRRWTDNWQRRDSSSLGWLTVWLVTCNGKSACAGGLINGGDTMLFLGMIDGGNTMLLLVGAGGQIDSRDTMLVNGLASYVQRQISVHGRTDQWQQQDTISWYD